MSYTTLYGITADGTPEVVEEFRNAWGGAMYVWEKMAERYLNLPSDPALGTSGFSMLFVRGDLKPVWALWKDPRVPENFKAVLGSTFDRVMVKGEDFARLADAFDAFVEAFPPGNRACSLSAQATALRWMAEGGEYRAACWQQTSVSEDQWFGWDEEADASVPYNIDQGSEHWFLYEDQVME